MVTYFVLPFKGFAPLGDNPRLGIGVGNWGQWELGSE